VNILVVSHFLPYPPHGGSFQRNYSLLREASRHNQVDFLAMVPRLFHPTEKELRPAVDAMRDICHEVKVFRIPTDSSRLGWYALLAANSVSPTPYSVWRFHSSEMSSAIRGQIKSECYDLIQIDTIALAPYVKLASGLPSVLIHQNVESSLLLRRAGSERNPLVGAYIHLQGRKLRRYESKIMKWFDLNVTVSELDKIELSGIRDGIRIEVIPNGTDTDYFRPSETSRSHELVFTGGMTWYPNRDAMIFFCRDVYPLIKRRVPDVTFNLIGMAPPPEVLEMARTDNSIRTPGYVDDVRPHVAKASVYVVPIRVGGGTRLKILDAFASGKALVSTTIGCEGLAVTPENDILIGDTSQEFADQVVRALTDFDLRMNLEKNARRLVEEKYSWTRIGQIQQALYESLKR
jgi:glycosyltransferase involved in cell wall biosynthesis